jgi:hypothetical protein
MRNELLGYLSIPVIVAGGMSVWKIVSPERGILPALPNLKWSKVSEDAKYSRENDEMVSLEPEEAAEMEESDDDGELTSADPGAFDDR